MFNNLLICNIRNNIYERQIILTNIYIALHNILLFNLFLCCTKWWYQSNLYDNYKHSFNNFVYFTIYKFLGQVTRNSNLYLNWCNMFDYFECCKSQCCNICIINMDSSNLKRLNRKNWIVKILFNKSKYSLLWNIFYCMSFLVNIHLLPNWLHWWISIINTLFAYLNHWFPSFKEGKEKLINYFSIHWNGDRK